MRMNSLMTKYLTLAITGILTLMSSCSDDVMDSNHLNGEKMRFRITIAGNEKSTRSSDKSETFDVERFGDSGLYLFTIIDDEVEKRARFVTTQTRALPIESMTDFQKNHKAFSLYAWNKKQEQSSYGVEPYIRNGKIEFTIDDSGDCTANSVYDWPDDESEMEILCVAPFTDSSSEESNVNSIFVVDNTNRTINFDYSVPKDVTDQTDLLVASQHVPRVESPTKYLDLQFHHILTAVKIKGSDELRRRIKEVTISGVYGKGSCAFSYGKTAFDWNIPTDAETTAFSVEFESGYELDASVNYVTDGETTMMMIPQTLKDGAKLNVTFDDGTSISGDISGEWKAGHTVTYVISPKDILEEYFFKIESYHQNSGISYTASVDSETAEEIFNPSFYDFANYNEDFNSSSSINENLGVSAINIKKDYVESYLYFLIQSYKSVYKKNATGNPTDKDHNGLKYPVAINREISDNTNNPWASLSLDDITEQHSEALSDREFTTLYRLKIDSRVTNVDMIDEKFPMPINEKSSEDTPIDLSMTTGTMNTANCYVVNNAGWYMFPLVYGNAIKNGVENEQSYKINATTFLKDHRGNDISNPWLSNVRSVTLLWTDTDDFIDVSPSIVTYGDDNRQYVRFYISEKTSTYGGNFVIAAHSGGTENSIMWSWHIWVTPYNMMTVSVGNSDFMTKTIGWVTTKSSKACEGRKFNLKFSQDGSRFSQEYDVEQNGTGKIVNEGRNIYYQWGRKDPMPSVLAANKKTPFREETSSSLKDCIMNPNVIYKVRNATDNAWYQGKSYLWGIRPQEYEHPIKTIYDPSPVGFRVPTSVELGKLRANAGWDSSNKGWEVNNGAIFIPASANLELGSDNSFTMPGKGSYGYLWSCSPVESGLSFAVLSFYLRNHNSYVQPLFVNDFGSYGYSCYPLLPVSE